MHSAAKQIEMCPLNVFNLVSGTRGQHVVLLTCLSLQALKYLIWISTYLKLNKFKRLKIIQIQQNGGERQLFWNLAKSPFFIFTMFKSWNLMC